VVDLCIKSRRGNAYKHSDIEQLYNSNRDSFIPLELYNCSISECLYAFPLLDFMQRSTTLSLYIALRTCTGASEVLHLLLAIISYEEFQGTADSFVVLIHHFIFRSFLFHFRA